MDDLERAQPGRKVNPVVLGALALLVSSLFAPLVWDAGAHEWMRDHVPAAFWKGGCFETEYGPIVFLVGAGLCAAAIAFGIRATRRAQYRGGVAIVTLGVLGAIAWAFAFGVLDLISSCAA